MSQKPRWETGLESAGDVTHRKRARGGFGGFLKSQLVELSWVEYWTPNEKGRLSRLAEARWICALRAPHEMGRGGRWKSQNRKNVYLSPYVEEPLKSKVIKSFVPELRSRKCFSCLGIPMFYVYIYIYIYEHSMYVSHVGVSGDGTNRTTF